MVEWVGTALEQLLKAATRAHYREKADTCPKCKMSGKQIVALRVAGQRHCCLDGVL